MDKTKFPRDEMDELWNELEKELTTRNRYCPDIKKFKLIQLINDQADSRKKILHQGKELLYRARVLTEKAFIESVKNTFQSTKDINSLQDAYCMTVEETPKENTKFFGFVKDQCDAPSIDKCREEGRCNPKGISYLYAATDLYTSIIEVRPYIKDFVSVATIELKKDIELYDFTKKPSFVTSLRNDIRFISEKFSKHVSQNNDNTYFITQFICEFIKKLGFDGIEFSSSLNEKGHNIVLFDTSNTGAEDTEEHEAYEIIGSKIYYINNLFIDHYEISPQNELCKGEKLVGTYIRIRNRLISLAECNYINVAEVLEKALEQELKSKGIEI